MVLFDGSLDSQLSHLLVCQFPQGVNVLKVIIFKSDKKMYLIHLEYLTKCLAVWPKIVQTFD